MVNSMKAISSFNYAQVHVLPRAISLDRGIPVDPIFDLQLGEPGGEEHQRNGDDIRFPLQMKRRLQRVVDERPRHLNHLLLLLVVHVFYVFREPCKGRWEGRDGRVGRAQTGRDVIENYGGMQRREKGDSGTGKPKGEELYVGEK